MNGEPQGGLLKVCHPFGNSWGKPHNIKAKGASCSQRAVSKQITERWAEEKRMEKAGITTASVLGTVNQNQLKRLGLIHNT